MKWRGRTMLACVLAATMALAGLSCGSIKDGWEDKAGPPRVVASFPPLACFVKNVGGDRAGVICLCTGTGPHDYQFNIRDSVLLKRADVFFANGLGLDDHFADKMTANGSNARLRYVKLADKLPANLRKKGEEHDHAEEGHAHDHDHHHGLYDPHVWLGIPQAINMVEQIRDGLKDVDKAHAGDYDRNATAYIVKLKKLHTEGKATLKKLKAPVITFHESMGYFAGSFGLNVIGSIEPTPGEQPSPRELAKLARQCANEARVIITVEPQYPETAAATLKKSLENVGDKNKKVYLVEIDPLETCDEGGPDADWYTDKMKANLDKLAKYAP